MITHTLKGKLDTVVRGRRHSKEHSDRSAAGVYEYRYSIHCKSEGLRKYFDQVYGTLQIALVHFFGNINKKA